MNIKGLTYDDVLQALRTEGKCSGKVDPNEYHAMKPRLEAELGVPVVSKSSLADFLASPYRYKFNLDHKIRKQTESLTFGSLIDCLVLTPELYEAQYLCEPVRVQTKKDGTPYADGRQDPAQREDWAAREAEGITVIAPETLAKARAVAEVATAALAEDKLAAGETFDSQVGMWVYLTSIAGRELVCPIVVTGMLDICPRMAGTPLRDLKSTSVDVGSPTQLCYTIEDWHYGLQGALYSDMWQICSGEEEARAFSFLFVGKSEPFMARSVHVGEDVLDLYRAEYAHAIIRYCLAWKTGDWGEAKQSSIYFSPSSREYKRIQNLEA